MTAEHPTDFCDFDAFGNNNFSKELADTENVITWLYKNAENYFIDKHDSSLNHWVCCKIKNSKNKGCHREFNVSSHSDTYSSSILFGKKWKCCRKSKRWDIGCVVIDNKNAKLITNSDVL